MNKALNPKAHVVCKALYRVKYLAFAAKKNRGQRLSKKIMNSRSRQNAKTQKLLIAAKSIGTPCSQGKTKKHCRGTYARRLVIPRMQQTQHTMREFVAPQFKML